MFKSFEGRQMAPEFEKPAFPRKAGFFYSRHRRDRLKIAKK